MDHREHGDERSGAANGREAPPALRRIGVFGGTFDPIHNGHLAAAEEARTMLGLEQVIFVPNWQQPLKSPGSAAPTHRLAMVEQAIAGNDGFVVSDLELRREGPSYSLTTLRMLQETWGTTVALFFLLGADAAAQFGAWHRPADILDLAHVVIMSRAGVREPDWPALEAINPRARERVHTLAVPDLAISATDLRQRLATGRAVRYQVPEAVYGYIRGHGLYQEPTPA